MPSPPTPPAGLPARKRHVKLQGDGKKIET
jgi:hypothetical protein